MSEGSPFQLTPEQTGGSTNVMARALGVPQDPVEATAFLAQNLRGKTKRRIGVGKMDDRYFMFFEDVDLGWRLNLRGWRYAYAPTSTAFPRRTTSASSASTSSGRSR